MGATGVDPLLPRPRRGTQLAFRFTRSLPGFVALSVAISDAAPTISKTCDTDNNDVSDVKDEALDDVAILSRSLHPEALAR